MQSQLHRNNRKRKSFSHSGWHEIPLPPEIKEAGEITDEIVKQREKIHEESLKDIRKEYKK